VTGYDHLLFLLGVIFFLYRLREVGAYVTLFALGHSVTLLYGVLGGVSVNAYLIDAIIGLSVVDKGLDKIGGFKRLLGFQPNTKAASSSSASFTGSAWRRSSRTLLSVERVSCPTSWRSTSASSSGSCWP